MAGLFVTLTLNWWMKSYAVTIWMKANIWSKLKIPVNRSFQLFFPSSNWNYLAKIPHPWKKLLVVSTLAKSEGDTFLNALKGEQRYSSSKSQIFHRHLYAGGGGGGGGRQVDDPTIQTSVTFKNIFFYKTLSNLAILLF